jgi:hypothetical protein
MSLDATAIPPFEAMHLLDGNEELSSTNYTYLDWDPSIKAESNNCQNHNVGDGSTEVLSSKTFLHPNVKGYGSDAPETGYPISDPLEHLATAQKNPLFRESKFEPVLPSQTNGSNPQELAVHRSPSIPGDMHMPIGLEDSTASSSASQRPICPSIVQEPGVARASQLSSTDMLSESNFCTAPDRNA